MEITRIRTSKLTENKGQIEGLGINPRQWTKAEVDRLAASLQETPELFEARPCIVVEHDDKYVVLGGNMRLTASRQLKLKDVPCVVFPADTPVSKLREIVIKDNGSFGKWDYDQLANEWDDLPLVDWGVPAWEAEQNATILPEDEDAELERKKKEFEERMKGGEDLADNEEYQEFLAKFEAKKTTDDCYTPPIVYEAVADYVADKYGLNRASFMRPFYPGGNYQKEAYVAGCVVVDNPPFSILSEILKFYSERKIKFFLFAPHLTLFSSSSSCTALPCGVGITYENGANVNTSFLTNLEPKSVRFRSAPGLYRVVDKANEENLKSMRKELPKYSYDHHIITTPFISQLSRLGIEFSVPVSESEHIRGLDAQKESGKAIFGSGYIVSDRVFAEREKAEREKAEREKAEREKAERWELSARERAIVEKLNKNVPM